MGPMVGMASINFRGKRGKILSAVLFARFPDAMDLSQDTRTFVAADYSVPPSLPPCSVNPSRGR